MIQLFQWFLFFLLHSLSLLSNTFLFFPLHYVWLLGKYPGEGKKMLPKGIFHILNVMERGKRINIEEKRRKGGKRFSSDFP